MKNINLIDLFKLDNLGYWILALGFIGLFYTMIYTCPFVFEKFEDGWYLMEEEFDVNTHNGNIISGYKKNSGPYTPKQMKLMQENCKKIKIIKKKL